MRRTRQDASPAGRLRRARCLALVALVAATVLSTAGTAGAVGALGTGTPLRPVDRSTGPTPDQRSGSPAVPLTLANVRAANVYSLSGGATSYRNVAPAVANAVGGPATGVLTVDFGSGSTFQLDTGGQVVTPGSTYNPGTEAGVSITADVDGESCTSTAGDGNPAYAEVNQYTYTAEPGSSSAVDTLAVVFECLDLDTGAYIYATLAYQILPTTPGRGYYIFDDTGDLAGYGNDNYLVYTGQPAFLDLNSPTVGMATTPDGGGYWMAGADGGVFSYGDARFHGSAGDLTLNSPVVGMAATPDGGGYWLVAADGGVFSYGDARFHGSAGDLTLNSPVVGMAATPDGGGYWLVAADGGIFSYGDARYHGSAGGLPLNAPVTGMVPTADGGGYWLVAADGGVFSYGDATFEGSAAGAQGVGGIVR